MPWLEPRIDIMPSKVHTHRDACDQVVVAISSFMSGSARIPSSISNTHIEAKRYVRSVSVSVQSWQVLRRRHRRQRQRFRRDKRTKRLATRNVYEKNDIRFLYYVLDTLIYYNTYIWVRREERERQSRCVHARLFSKLASSGDDISVFIRPSLCLGGGWP